MAACVRSASSTEREISVELNCSGHSDYNFELNSMRLLLRMKLAKTDQIYPVLKQKQMVVSITCYVPCLVLLAFL